MTLIINMNKDKIPSRKKLAKYLNRQLRNEGYKRSKNMRR